jgi:hypothetical protein
MNFVFSPEEFTALLMLSTAAGVALQFLNIKAWMLAQ